MSATCGICKSPKAKRSCPVEGEICPQCCGRDREETIDCPVDCEFLIESRLHAKPGPLDRSLNPDLNPSEEFVKSNHPLFMVAAIGLLGAALESPTCVDRDLEDCLDAAIRNRRTRRSGLIYDARPDNAVAAAILEIFDARLEEFRAESAKWDGYRSPSEADVLTMLAFLRMAAGSNNSGRRKSRAFLHFLMSYAANELPPEGEEPAGRLIV